MTPSKKSLENIYGSDGLAAAEKRFENISSLFTKAFGSDKMEFFTAPGRTEVIGNHTDHNGGKVIAGSITLDTIGAAYPNGTDEINILSEGFDEVVKFNISDVESVPKCRGSLSLVAGMVSAIKKFGHKVGGFNLYTSTTVIASAGVSSSAAFEMLVCSVINYFFNDNKLSIVDYAKIGQSAENVFWCKASGLMDQMACAAGGAIKLDFAESFNNGTVKYEKIDLDFKKYGYDIVIVNTGKGHADLSAEYSSVPGEMREVAKELGVKNLCESSVEKLLEKTPELIGKLNNDRALLRAFHFFNETNRVEQMADAIAKDDGEKILKLVDASGRSSFELLQNCYVNAHPEEQKISLCLALTTQFINKIGKGVCRVHGGGFAGVIMAIIPSEHVNEYISYMEGFVGKKNAYLMNIRKVGAAHIEK